MRTKISVFGLIFTIFVMNNILFVNPNIFAESVSSREEPDPLYNKKEDVYNKVIKALLQENEDLRAGFSKLKKLNMKLEIKAKELYLKARDSEEKKKDLINLSKAVRGLNRQQGVLKEANEKLMQRVNSLEETLQAERAGLYQELGGVYTKAKLFSRAIDAYLKSLSFRKNNAEIHYNLGLLYQYLDNNTGESSAHFKKYLELEPNAKKRKEAEYLMDISRERISEQLK